MNSISMNNDNKYSQLYVGGEREVTKEKKKNRNRNRKDRDRTATVIF